ncbi:MAG TPA: hypothetical protein VFC75_02310, partial [Erysipelothrix sp.]|nr:hypothetical protein [Erysipelothrix sp.]
MNNKWHMNRFGLIDFWYYDYQEFHFKDGHMMLRGGNGSGKSVTMQSFLPLILDGNKSSSRLDPFGSRDRKIEDYLLDEAGQRNDRIGYLFLEFKRKDLDIYKTVGLGMQARKNTKLNTWYFVIEDNKRIGKDIELYQRNLAISKQSLKNIIGDQLIETQGEYSRRVNEALFGFETEQEYKEVLDLMIQLRSPKLSNSLKPVTLNEILNNSLQPLSDEDLRPMSEAITSMDATKDQVLILEENLNASKKIIEVYDQYNYRVLFDKTQKYLEEEKETRSTTRKTQDAIKQRQSAEEEKLALEKENVQLEHEMMKLRDEKSSLSKEDLDALVDQLKNDKQEINLTKTNVENKQAQIEIKETSRRYAEDEKKTKENQAYLGQKEMMQSFKVLEELQIQLQFEEHAAIENDLIKNLKKPYNPSYTYTRIDKETEKINEGLKKFEAISKLEQEYQTYLEIVEKERFEEEMIQKQKVKEKTLMQQHIENTTVAYHQWNQKNLVLKIDTPTLEDIVFEIENSENNDTSLAINELVYKGYRQQSASFIKKEESLAHALKLLRQNQNELKDTLNIWQETEDPQLPLDESTTQNRALLKELGINHISLYELLEFDEKVSETLKGQIEEKLRRSNLLGAQIIHQDDLEHVTSKNHETSDHYLVTQKKVESLEPIVLTQDLLMKEDYSSIFESLGIHNFIFKNKSDHVFYHNLLSVISTKESARYIGKKAREAYRAREIERLSLEIESLENEILSILGKLDELDKQKKILVHEHQAQPNLDAIHKSRAELIYLNKRILEKVNTIHQYEKHLESISEKTRADLISVSEIAHTLGISSNENAFK